MADILERLRKWPCTDLPACNDAALEIERLKGLLKEVVPMVESYRRKHERAYAAAERKFITQYMEDHAETVGKCDRILSQIEPLAAPAGDADPKREQAQITAVRESAVQEGNR